jgi:Ca2+-binding EF-hand superfamily protein
MLTAAGFIFQATPVLAEMHGDHDMKHKEKMEEMFNETDVNNDGMISEDEYMVHVRDKAAEKFDDKDGNDDGMVSMEEAREYYAEKKEKWKEKKAEMKDKYKSDDMSDDSDM